MTTDPFTEAARAEAERRNPSNAPKGLTRASNAISRRDFRDGAEWARTHLAAQEPTDAECAAVLDVKYGGPVGPYDEPYDAEEMAEARAALSAARTARRDEEER